MRRRIPGIALLLLPFCGCAASPDFSDLGLVLGVTLTDLPKEAVTVEPAVAWNRTNPDSLRSWLMAAPIAPQDLRPLREQAAQGSSEFKEVALELHLPEQVEPFQWLSVGVRAQDAQGQLIAVASGQQRLTAQQGEVILPLWDNVRDPRNQRPLLALAQPALLKKDLPRQQIILYGWGLTPDLAVQVGGQAVTELTWLSVTQVVARLDAAPPPGAVAVKITTGQGQDQRADLLRVE